ncbi:hypothetical protein [Kistimonas asteriae]|uniref:hypothetical protein n=1 Tax=Kistimonas asteriae TaxID=517724 RepID=UPI001BA7F3E2|nr:hypothetical protein [Kistimonas asteriae]
MRSISSMPLVFALVVSGSMAHAGTVEIHQEIFPLFEVSARGIEGLEDPAIATGSYHLASYSGFPVNTIMTLTPVFDGLHNYPAGLVSWKHGREKDQYMFIISAGGYLGGDNKMDEYCVHLNLNFKEVGKNCTSHTGYWNPTILENQSFPKNSRLSITIKSS